MTMTADGLAKLLEECGELSQVAAKKLAYFHTDNHPDGVGSLKSRMQEEIADVAAACRFVSKKFGLDKEVMQNRFYRKLALFEKWDAETDNNSEAVDRERKLK